MQIPTSQIKSWGIVSWQNNVCHAAPSKGGAVGVMFCWTLGTLLDNVDYDEPSTAQFVIKPSAGSAAPFKLAEDLMARTIDAASVNTLAIPRTDSRFQAILMNLQRHRDEVSSYIDLQWQKVASVRQMRQMQHMPQVQQMLQLRDRWNHVWPHYQNAHTLMVQDIAQGVKEFADVYRDYNHMGLQRALARPQLMQNFGKLFVVDAVLGNGDRLSAMNTGNLLYDDLTSRIWSIDSQALLTDYQNSLTRGCHQARNWVDVLVGGGQAAPEQEGGVQAPTFALRDLYDVDDWWVRSFRPHLEQTLRSDNQPLPSEHLWQRGLTNFRIGVNDGLVAVDNQLSGFNWLAVKNTFKEHEKRYGSSPNLDWTNFKIRRMYVRMALAERDKPGTVQEKRQRALSRLVAYAERKVGGLHV